MQGLVVLTVVLPLEDAELLQRRVFARAAKHKPRMSRDDGLLAELGLERQARLLPAGVRARVSRGEPGAVPHVVRAWVSRACIITGDVYDMLSGRSRLLAEARALGMLGEDIEIDDDPPLGDPDLEPRGEDEQEPRGEDEQE